MCVLSQNGTAGLDFEDGLQTLLAFEETQHILFNSILLDELVVVCAKWGCQKRLTTPGKKSEQRAPSSWKRNRCPIPCYHPRGFGTSSLCRVDSFVCNQRDKQKCCNVRPFQFSKSVQTSFA